MLSVRVYYTLFQFLYFYFASALLSVWLDSSGVGELDAPLDVNWHFKLYFLRCFL